MIGALQCLTMTRPDIIYAIHTVFLIYTYSSYYSSTRYQAYFQVFTEYFGFWLVASSCIFSISHHCLFWCLTQPIARILVILLQVVRYFLDPISSPGASRSGLQFSNLPLKLSTRLLLTALLKLFEFASYLMIWVSVFPILPRSTVGILVLLIWQWILFGMIIANI